MKWIFSDYDGTINKNRNDILDECDIKFIQEWEKENKFVVNSGRMPKEIIPHLDNNKIDWEYIVCNNGSLVYQRDKGAIFYKTIDESDVKNIFNVFKNTTAKIKLYFANTIETKFIEMQNTDLKLGFEEDQLIHDLRFSKSSEDELLNSNDITSFTFFAVGEEYDELIKEIKKVSPNISIVEWSNQCAEIVAPGIAKHVGIQFLQEKLNIDINDIYTVGDGPNDIDMLTYAKHSFVIESQQTSEEVLAAGKNKIKCVCEIGDYVSKQ